MLKRKKNDDRGCFHESFLIHSLKLGKLALIASNALNLNKYGCICFLVCLPILLYANNLESICVIGCSIFFFLSHPYSLRFQIPIDCVKLNRIG